MTKNRLAWVALLPAMLAMGLIFGTDQAHADVSKIFAQSDSTTQALYIPVNSYMRDSTGILYNWPKRSDRCAGYTPTSELKAIPILPRVDLSGGDLDFYVPNEIYTNSVRGNNYNKYGALRNWAGDCNTTGASLYWMGLPTSLPKFNSFDISTLKALRDGGTSAVSQWGVKGFSASPYLYGGWATTLDGYSAKGWVPAVEVGSGWSGVLKETPVCHTSLDSTYSGKHNGTVWVARALESKPEYKGLTIKPIWGRYCQNARNHGPDLFRAANYSEDYSTNLLSSDARHSSRWSAIGYGDSLNGIYSGGMTLFRKEINFSEQDIADIREAEGFGGGLKLDMIADDFFAIYVNGEMIFSNIMNASGNDLEEEYNYIASLKSSYLRVGKNLIAIEVIDKFTSNWNDLVNSGVGLGYVLMLDNPAKITSGYKLFPSTNCISIVCNDTARVPAGSSADVVHKPNVVFATGWGPKNMLTTNHQVKCSVTLPDGTVITIPYDVNNIASGCADNFQTSHNPGKLHTELSKTIIVSNSATPGTKICTWIEYRPPGLVGGRPIPGAAISQPACFTVGDSPKSAHILFQGGDVYANGTVKFSPKNPSGFGSMSQYAMLVNGNINNYIYTANNLNDSDAGGRYNLLYAYRSSPAKKGGFGGQGSGSASPVGPVTGAPSCSALNNALIAAISSSEYKCSGNLNLNGDITISKPIRLTVNGNININGNITLNSSPVGSLAELPNLIIMATGNIIINSNVERVDATLISNGTISTCNSVGSPPASATTCNKRLTINGPTKARYYNFYRTNTDTTATEAAEVFKFPPASIMSQYATGNTGNSLIIDYEIELPPRY